MVDDAAQLGLKQQLDVGYDCGTFVHNDDDQEIHPVAVFSVIAQKWAVTSGSVHYTVT